MKIFSREKIKRWKKKGGGKKRSGREEKILSNKYKIIIFDGYLIYYMMIRVGGEKV